MNKVSGHLTRVGATQDLAALDIDLAAITQTGGCRSTRIGAAHDMVDTGIDLTSIMHAGGWNDPKMSRYYTRELAAESILQ